MTVQQPKRRPLSRYLKDFKHSQTHCAHCHKLLDRITLVRRGEIVNKIAISRLDMLLDEAAWQQEQKEWVALCRFCGDLHCKEQSDFFDIIGFKQFLFDHTEMSHGTVREYVVRLRRLGNHLVSLISPVIFLTKGILMRIWSPGYLPPVPIITVSRCVSTHNLKHNHALTLRKRSLSVLDLIYIKNE
jgi:flagellar regulatory protein FliZ